MSLATVESRAERGIQALQVSVEVHITRGLPAFAIVGLPEAAVRESRDRVRSAIINSNFEFPRQRITVNLAPADLPKQGGRYDLAIALGVLAASGQLPLESLQGKVFIGELALDGSLRKTDGVLVTALSLRAGDLSLIVPSASAAEAALVPNIAIYQAGHLLEVVGYLSGQHVLDQPKAVEPTTSVGVGDLSDVKGQAFAKRALEVAAAGQHNLLFYGPPGTGKTMLASRLAGLMPRMNVDQALESAAVQSLSHHGFDITQWRQRPFRAPHHSASGAAIIGGGSNAQPGEISLAHNGVLFLDELTEFDRKVLETLREPLESGRVTISRVARSNQYPAAIVLVAAMNPCPCGYYGDHSKGNSDRCRCTPAQIERYRSKISGPLLDRIDLHVEVPRVPQDELTDRRHDSERSDEVRKRVIAARGLQEQRQGSLNSELSSRQVDQYCELDAKGQGLINSAMERLGLSARSYYRILKVSRTIADLAGSKKIATKHLAEAIQLRSLDRQIT